MATLITRDKALLRLARHRLVRERFAILTPERMQHTLAQPERNADLSRRPRQAAPQAISQRRPRAITRLPYHDTISPSTSSAGRRVASTSARCAARKR